MAIAAAQIALVIVPSALYAAVALTIWYAAAWETSAPPPPEGGSNTVPRVVKLFNGANVAPPLLMPNDPISSSRAWVVVAVAPELARVPLAALEDAATLSSRAGARPLTANAAAARLVMLGWVIVIVVDVVRAVVTVAEQITVRMLVLVTLSDSFV